ncbi:MAG: cyclic-di-AMP receptor [Lawsonibacter sp.]
MKLMFAVIRDKDANDAMDHLIRQHIGVTKLASTGGFLRDGNTTLMVGVEDGQVEEVMEILKKNCARRSEVEIAPPHSTGGVPVWSLGYTPVKVEVGGATVFVVDVAQFQKL